MCRTKTMAVLATAAFLVTTLDTAQAEITTIIGKVIFKGKTEKYERKVVNTAKHPVCKVEIRTNGVILNKTNPVTLRNVVVSVKDGLGARVFPVRQQKNSLSLIDCRFSPHVVVLQEGQDLHVYNGDDTKHAPLFLATINARRSFVMPKKDMLKGEVFKLAAEAPFRVKCNVHPWETSHIGIFSHPFYAVTSLNGRYELKGMGPGTYTLEAWHETFGTVSAKVTVEKGSTATLDFVFEPDKKQ